MTTPTAGEVPLLLGAGTRPDQIGVLVPSLMAALASYGYAEQWRIWTYGPDTVRKLTVRDAPGYFAMRIALNSTAPQMELLEPLAGPSIYHEWIDAHGYGLHHLGYFVPNLESAIEAMTAHGFTLLQTGLGFGSDGSGGFAYFDTTRALGYITEAIEPPAARRRPKQTWPPEQSTGGRE
jgi:hypothetical protein